MPRIPTEEYACTHSNNKHAMQVVQICDLSLRSSAGTRNGNPEIKEQYQLPPPNQTLKIYIYIYIMWFKALKGIEVTRRKIKKMTTIIIELQEIKIGSINLKTKLTQNWDRKYYRVIKRHRSVNDTPDKHSKRRE